MDLDTGEVMEHATMALILRRSKNGFGKRWFAMAQDPAIFLAENGRKIGQEGFMVLMFLMGSLDYENDIAVSQVKVAERLGMQRQGVYRAIKKLIAMGIIEQGESLGNMPSYRLSPTFGWKGKGAGHIKALQAA